MTRKPGARPRRAVAAAAYATSPALQQAGTQGLISSFFDELFNHFDPYSRYEPPVQAAQDQLMITGLAGTGLTFAAQHGNDVAIAGVAADSPAEEAGLAPATWCSRSNGSPVYPGESPASNASMNGLARHHRHAAAWKTRPIRRPPADVTLTRAFIPPQTVFAGDRAGVPGSLSRLKSPASTKAPATSSPPPLATPCRPARRRTVC